MSLKQEIARSLELCIDEDVRTAYEARLSEGGLVRDDNERTHFCAYFVPLNRIEKTILVGDHKKSGLWLMPGGHIDANETLLETLNREIEEELGISSFYTERPIPVLLTVTQIEHDVRPCRTHFDIWHIMETDGSNISVDYTEYHEVRWVSIGEARQLIQDPANCAALDVLERIFQG